MLRPLEMMWARVERGREDSDTALFMDLLYAGEMVLRLTVAVFVAAIQDDRERNRYRLLHRIVRADGIGEWTQALDDALGGPASQHLFPTAKEARRELTERFDKTAWQYECVIRLHDALQAFMPDTEPLAVKGSLRQWFGFFPVIRNKTRAHGAPTAAICKIASPWLESSIRLLVDNASIFKYQWAYLHRNLSGKYRIINIGTDVSAFESLKTREGKDQSYRNLDDGIYIAFDKYTKVDLLYTTADMNDYFFPNGGFKDRKYELHSLVTDSRLEGDATPYLLPATERPISETEGKGELDAVGSVFTNLPPMPTEYVSRPNPEDELIEELLNDRHAVITLVGRGGIGKTSLALKVLYSIASEPMFDFIFWFSARDIDLLPIGPKVVRAHVLTEKDVADEFVRLVASSAPIDKSLKPIEFLGRCMASTALGGNSIFVFDNFETAKSPLDLFNWIDMHVRLPNKVLITSRFREFRADYPIEIGGMERREADLLIEQTASKLGVQDLINDSYRETIFEESDGHPYVIKIILGEIASKKQVGRPERIIARKDEILDALFERTYANLTPAARRVFLTLCAWRSFVPQLALEAVLLRPENDRMDVPLAVDELVRMSLVERNRAADGTDFLNVPLVAAIFGEKKLRASPIRSSIEADVRMLQEIGPTSEARMKEGIAPKVQLLFERSATRIAEGKTEIEKLRPVLEFVARSYPPGWLLLADMFEEHGGPNGLQQAAESVRRFLETGPSSGDAWRGWERLAGIYVRMGDIASASDAYVRAVEFRGVPFALISNVANWLNIHRAELSDQEPFERDHLFRRMITLMENRIKEATATDLSRLAWLYLPRDTSRAMDLAVKGLKEDPSNAHCLKLVDRLKN